MAHGTLHDRAREEEPLCLGLGRSWKGWGKNGSIVHQFLLHIWVIMKELFRRIVIAALVFTVAPTYIRGKGNPPLRVDILREAPLDVAAGTLFPVSPALVGFQYESVFAHHCSLLSVQNVPMTLWPFELLTLWTRKQVHSASDWVKRSKVHWVTCSFPS